jgi:hypothetical protein
MCAVSLLARTHTLVMEPRYFTPCTPGYEPSVKIQEDEDAKIQTGGVWKRNPVSGLTCSGNGTLCDTCVAGNAPYPCRLRLYTNRCAETGGRRR